MKKSTITKILITVLSLVLFFLGVYCYGQFLEWTLPNIKGLKFQEDSTGGQFASGLIFGLVLALIPISAFFTWKFAPIKQATKKILNILILIACVAVTVFIKRAFVLSQSESILNKLPKSLDNQVGLRLPLEDFNFTNYMLLGLLIGTAVSYFLLREKVVNK